MYLLQNHQALLVLAPKNWLRCTNAMQECQMYSKTQCVTHTLATRFLCLHTLVLFFPRHEEPRGSSSPVLPLRYASGRNWQCAVYAAVTSCYNYSAVTVCIVPVQYTNTHRHACKHAWMDPLPHQKRKNCKH